MGLFSSDTDIEYIPLTAEQKKARAYLDQLLAQGTPNFPTQQIAGMSGNEQTAQGLLQQYLSGAPQGYDAAIQQLMSTVSGQYDPRTSPYYSGFRQQSALDESEAVSGLRRGAQAGGMFYSEPSMRSEARLRAGYGAERDTMLGQLLDAERNRSLSAVPTLLQAGQEPMNRVAAGMQYGALPRQLSQAENDAQYQTLLERLMFPYTQGQQMATNLWGMTPDYYMSESPSLFSQVAGVAGPLLGAGASGAGYLSSILGKIAAGSQPQYVKGGLSPSGNYDTDYQWGGMPVQW